jgi:hypothetical protein
MSINGMWLLTWVGHSGIGPATLIGVNHTVRLHCGRQEIQLGVQVGVLR